MLTEWLRLIITLAARRLEKFSAEEEAAYDIFMATLKPRIVSRQTRTPIVVGIIGLVGSGKSSLARALAQRIGASVIEGDAIRVELRKRGHDLRGTRKLAERAAIEVLRAGGNAIIDSDHIDTRKRASLRRAARNAGGRLVLIRTFADRDVIMGRIITAPPDEFFSGAKTLWQGNERTRCAVVKLREFWRRTPHHYRWTEANGGTWLLKKLPFSIFAEVDTTNARKWRRAVETLGERVRKL